MATQPTFTCATCDVSITQRPTFHLGLAFCCAGCAADGPCMCSYDGDDPVPLAAATGAPLAAPAGRFAAAPAALPAPVAVPGRRPAPAPSAAPALAGARR